MLAFGLRPVIVASGSMEPQIHTGALAFDRPIPASQAKVGDVVTLQKESREYVTHRVVASSEGPDGLTQLTLRGDANGQDDPAPYLVSEVGQYLGSVPVLGYVCVWVRNNLVIAGLILLAIIVFSFSGGPRVSVVMPDGSVVKGLTRASAKRLVESMKQAGTDVSGVRTETENARTREAKLEGATQA
jgi:signal peptidase I